MQHFQRQILQKGEADEMYQTRSFLLELANDTGKLAQMFPMMSTAATGTKSKLIKGKCISSIFLRHSFRRAKGSWSSHRQFGSGGGCRPATPIFAHVSCLPSSASFTNTRG
jgi:hypothetical protein